MRPSQKKAQAHNLNKRAQFHPGWQRATIGNAYVGRDRPRSERATTTKLPLWERLQRAQRAIWGMFVRALILLPWTRAIARTSAKAALHRAAGRIGA